METTEFSWSRRPKSWPEINSRPKIINWYSWGFEAGSTPRKVCLAFNLDEIQMVSEMVGEIQEGGPSVRDCARLKRWAYFWSDSRGLRNSIASLGFSQIGCD
jgi:hypothetical protein